MNNREYYKELLPIIQAFAEGKVIQFRCKTGEWLDIINNEFDFILSPDDYRIKPEPKYRPFKSQEECWNEMHKHPDFGWVVSKNCKIMYHIYSVYDVLAIGYIYFSFDEMYQKYEFLDGTPFGVKVEE